MPLTVLFFVYSANAEEIKKIGVAECDHYVEKIMSCVKTTTSLDVQESTQKNINQNLEHWKIFLTTEENKKALGEICKKALVDAKEAFKPYGCSL